MSFNSKPAFQSPAARRQAALDAIGSAGGAVKTAEQLQRHRDALLEFQQAQLVAAQAAKEEMIRAAEGRREIQRLAQERPAKDGQPEFVIRGELSGAAEQEYLDDMIKNSQKKSCRGLAHFAQGYNDQLVQLNQSGDEVQIDNVGLSSVLVGMLSHIAKLERQQKFLIDQNKKQAELMAQQAEFMAQMAKRMSKQHHGNASVFDSASS